MTASRQYVLKQFRGREDFVYNWGCFHKVDGIGVNLEEWLRHFFRKCQTSLRKHQSILFWFSGVHQACLMSSPTLWLRTNRKKKYSVGWEILSVFYSNKRFLTMKLIVKFNAGCPGEYKSKQDIISSPWFTTYVHPTFLYSIFIFPFSLFLSCSINRRQLPKIHGK